VVVALGGDVGLGVRAWDTWGGAEVLLCLSVLGSSKKEGVSTSGCKEHELVKSEALSTSFNDSGSCGLGEFQGSNGELGEVNESNVISHSANHDGDPVPKP
jgi:hypothetical protein